MKSKLTSSLFLTAILSLGLVSCSDDDKANELTQTYPEITTSEVAFPYGTNEKSIEFISSIVPTISADEWIKTTLEEQTSATRTLAKTTNYLLKISVDENKTEAERTGKVVITTDDKTTTLTIVQASTPTSKGFFVLSNGGWDRPASDISFYDAENESFEMQEYSEVNGEILGDQAEDMLLYDSKLFVTISSDEAVGPDKSFVAVIEPSTLKLIKKIPFKRMDNDFDRARYMTAKDGKIYVTGSIGSVVEIDVKSLEITRSAALTGNASQEGFLFSDGIAEYNGKLFVCNSNYGDGNTISVVDIATMKEIKSIETASYPYHIVADKDAVYFSTYPGWSDAPALYQIDTDSYEVIDLQVVGGNCLALTPESVYTAYVMDYSPSTIQYNRKTKEVKNLPIANSGMAEATSIDYNPINQHTYVGYYEGQVKVYDKDFKEIDNHETDLEIVAKIVPYIK